MSRSRPSNVLAIYDFPSAVQTAPDREVTTTTLQQIFVMNSPFVHRQAAAVAERARAAGDGDAQVRATFRLVLARDPGASELARARRYLQRGTLERWAQVLLCTNEEIFQP